MQNIKKIIAVLLTVSFLFLLASCGSKGGEEERPLTIAVLKGPTGMGISKLADDAKNGKTKNSYAITMASSPDDITAMVSSGEVDIATCPINMASILYNKMNQNVRMLAINTLGVLYILENGNAVTDMKSLKGKTIYATGQGSTPEYVLNDLLEKNGLVAGEDVTVEYKSDHTELATLAAAGKVEICMLPEPNVTVVLSQNPEMRIALDMTQEWQKVSEEDSPLVQGCVIVNAQFLQENPQAIDLFLEEYKASVDFVNQHHEEAASLIVQEGILPSEAVAKKAIPNCNITFITGSEMIRMAEDNLRILYHSNPNSIGKVLPDENFYYNPGS